MSKVLASGWIENDMPWGRIYVLDQNNVHYFLASCGYETSPPDFAGPPGSYRLWTQDKSIKDHSHLHEKLTAKYGLPPLFEEVEQED